MKDGLLAVAAINMGHKGSVEKNITAMCELAEKASKKARIIVFSELSISGADYRDIFLHKGIRKASGDGLLKLLEGTKGVDALLFAGLPVSRDGKIYDCVAVMFKGEVLGVIPRQGIPADSYEDMRPFSPADGNRIFSTDAIFGLTIGVAIGKDIDNPDYFGGYKPLIVVNPTASMHEAGKYKADEDRLVQISKNRLCAVISVNAGPGGASTDGIYAGGAVIATPEGIAAKASLYEEDITYAIIDTEAILSLRGKDSLFENNISKEPERAVFLMQQEETGLFGDISKHPFFPEDEKERQVFCREVFEIQKHALMERMSHIGMKKVVLGVSGGLDSTLALLVAKEAIETFGYDSKNLIAITLPGFGTTDRTYDNAVGMIKSVGADFREISIKKAVEVHFEDIGQKEGVYDLTFENAQARERTQILMDVGGREGALMIGTGDMSEIALGWCTYNGDHMAMYSVNGGVTKTMIREIIRDYAQNRADSKLKDHLLDVIDTPISPELMPTEEGKSTQKTEDKVGPYELSDFFLYYVLKYGFEKEKVRRLAIYAFKDSYAEEEIDKWLGVFFNRFVSQAFKRSCMPDGPKVLGLSLSPRTGLRMASDLKEI